jgi:hypothetical protein
MTGAAEMAASAEYRRRGPGYVHAGLLDDDGVTEVRSRSGLLERGVVVHLNGEPVRKPLGRAKPAQMLILGLILRHA